LLKLLLAECAIVLLAIAAIVIGYAWLLPHFFHDGKTYSVLVGGIALAAISGGFAAKAFANREGIRRWAFPVLWGLIVAGAVSLGATAILVSLFGS
jgi:hypothetical protein